MRNSTALTSLPSLIVLAAACAVGAASPVAAHADANSFTLRQPLNNASVRETVPVRVPPALLRQAGYATITIDGQFRGAPAVPSGSDVVYEWDTKHSEAPPSDSGAGASASADQTESPDGKHVIQVSLFDKDSNPLATATSTVRVLNHITALPDGVRLVYKWRPDEVVTYRLHSVLKSQQTAADASAQTPGGQAPAIQDVYARLQRSVEDASGAGVLLRDHYAGGTFGAEPLTQAFTLSSKYITVDKNGDLLTENHPLGSGLHYGYGIDSFPARRVAAGDSWQTEMMVSLPWAVEKMTRVRGQARLDDFEWENNYPTAKIVETYTGPATFRFDSSAQTASLGGFESLGQSAQTQDNSVHAENVTVKRTIWFAYESGVVVREETTLTTDQSALGSYASVLAAPATAPAGGGSQGGYGGPRGGYGGPGAPGGPPTGGPGAPNSYIPNYGNQGYTPPGSTPGTSGSTPASSNIESDKTLTLISVS